MEVDHLLVVEWGNMAETHSPEPICTYGDYHHTLPIRTSSICVKSKQTNSFLSIGTLLIMIVCRFGPIISTKAILDKATNRCKGYGFVDFESPTSALAAVNELQGQGIQVLI